MKQVLIRQGRAVVEEIPAPQVEPGSVLVAVARSCISIGTELSGIKQSGQPLWKRALQHPEKIKQAVNMALTEGIARTRSRVSGALAAGSPIGYAVAGEVLEVGRGIADLRVGDRVACGGAQCAFHAEIVRVPRNLMVSIPDGLDYPEASTVTLGAIALQGVRRAQPTIGECFVVLGLGILGQLTVQILKANGCRVIGTDVDPDRIRLAQTLGLDVGLSPDSPNDVEEVVRCTDGIGADGVIITAATPSDAVVSTAFTMCRKKGRVVLVGDVGLNLNRADFYAKELDFFISSSYGPGRYDRGYEENGLDYPVAYVRWTENRNMAEYLRLVARGLVRLKPLISETYPVDSAAKAYEAIESAQPKPLMVLLSYSRQQGTPRRVVPHPIASAPGRDAIRIAVIGTGGFATGMHLPNLQRLSDRYLIHAVCGRSGHNASNAARRFGAQYATTDYESVLGDADVDAVLIATRHNLHTPLALAALRAGKHVLVEKPLAMTQSDLDKIVEFYECNPNGPLLLTGFNRRFSPHITRIKDLTGGRSNPMMLNYRMNAGHIPLDHWVHGQEGGGRNIGEACHIYDLFTYLTDARVTAIQAQSVTPATAYYSAGDNFVATLKFADGSVATLTYTALGAKAYPKEKLEVYVDGKVLVMDDYRSLTVHGAKVGALQTKIGEKGHLEQAIAFSDCIREAGPWPNPLWHQVQATEISFGVEENLRG